LNDNNVVVGSSTTGQTVGQLIGTSSTTNITRAFVWNAGVITELTPFNLYSSPGNIGASTNYHSVANDINNAGLIVGNSQRTSGSAAVATLWQGGVPIDLNTLLPAGSGWSLLSAEGINNADDIVGFGTIGGVQHGFLLTAVPEPTSALMLVTALAGLSFGMRHRRAK
jgi:probable HAF family extracellular repeat protein